MNLFNIKLLKNSRLGKFTYLICLPVIFLCALYMVYSYNIENSIEPQYILSFLIIGLVSILALWVYYVANVGSGVFIFVKSGKEKVSKLRKRIIVAFIVGSAVPTILVAVFSTYLFNFGIDAWFDKKVSRVLDQSVSVGEAYIEEHVLQLKETAISVSEDFSSMYYDLIHSPVLFNKVINAQAQMRSFDEAIVFQKDTNTILAQTALSFSLSFINIPSHLINRADKGEVVYIKSNPLKVRILIKMRNYNNTYLLVGRLVDEKIIDHINKTNGAASEYNSLKKKMMSMQVQFSVVFILLSLCLLVTATIWGRSFAEKIVKPIRHLVIAAERVQNGDLSAQVPTEGLNKDEVRVLSVAFNHMVTQIDHQQKELVVAQRALAWSDVARRVAHEIKNPLTPIQLSAERLQKKFRNEVLDQESFNKYTKNILKHSDDIKAIVSEFVEFARLPASNFVECEIISLVRGIVESRKIVSDNIVYNFESNVQKCDTACDISQINRVMTNLILNAEESIKEASGKKKTIEIKIFCNQEILQIDVIDNGPGFSKDVIDSAKEAYVTTKRTGTGLGLAIVDRIVVEHRGSIQLSNVEPSGAMVRLIFNPFQLKLKLK